MKTKDYLVIKDNIIIKQFSTTQGINGVKKSLTGVDYDEIKEFPKDKGCPLNLGIHTKDDVRHFDKTWKRKTVKKLLSENLITLKDDEELDEKNNCIVKKAIPKEAIKETPLTPEQEREIAIQNKMMEILRSLAVQELGIADPKVIAVKEV